MNELIGIIMKYISDPAGILTCILFWVFMILNISDYFEKICDFVKKVLNIKKHIDTLFYSKVRASYDKNLCSDKYIEWQMKIL